MKVSQPAGLLICAGMLVLTMLSCASRYRLDLFLVKGEDHTRVKIEKTEYLLGAVLGDPFSEDKVIRGDGNCLVVVTGSRGKNLESRPEDVVTFDRFDRYRIFFRLPAAVRPDTLPLKDNSFVQLMGRYELSSEDKMYFPVEGQLVIDSLAGHHLFGTLRGSFENRQKESVTFQGQFKAKVAK